jgi:hypothetical protein
MDKKEQDKVIERVEDIPESAAFYLSDNKGDDDDE